MTMYEPNDDLHPTGAEGAEYDDVPGNLPGDDEDPPKDITGDEIADDDN